MKSMNVNTINDETTAQGDHKNPLEPLLFLEGDWHGNGQGPYGLYEFNMHVESRGRWILLTSTVFVPQTDTVSYVSTQVYGYAEDGLTLDLFDTAGAFHFHYSPRENGVSFDWKDGDDWKRSEFWQENTDEVHFKYVSMEPAASKDLSTFEGIWLRGPRLEKA